MPMADVAAGGVPRVEVTAAQRAQYEEQCDDLIERTLETHDRFHGGGCQKHEWKLLRQKRALRIYRHGERSDEASANIDLGASSSSIGSGSSETSREPLLMCSGLVPGTVDDLLLGTYSDSSESLRIGMSVLTDGKFMDAALVHVFESHGVRAPVMFSGIKWVAIKSPTASALIHDRELLTFQRIGRIVDRHGRYFAYVVTQSVDVAEWPAQRQRHLERAHISQCFLFRQVQDSWVACFCLGSASMRGSLPRHLNELLTAENLLQLGNFLTVARAKNFSALLAASADRLASPSSSCEVCMKTKQLTGRRLCMGCKRQVCRKCSEKRVVFRLQVRSQQPVKEVFCVQCIAHVTRPKAAAREEQLDAGLARSSSGSASTGARSHKSGLQASSHSSTPESELDSHAWLPMPETDLPSDLHGLTRFVERAKTQHWGRWNVHELAYLEGLLRDPSASRSHSDESGSSEASGGRSFHAGASLPPGGSQELEEEHERLTRSQGAAARHDKCFSVDDLD